MRERYVVCGELSAGRARPGALHLDVNAPARSPTKVNLHIADISGPLADNIPDVLTDMLEIAAYVYCADQFTSRGSTLMSHMGADWRRRFRFKIPVREPAVWTKPQMLGALRETLSFLSEDEFEFEFLQAVNPAALPSYLGFSDSAAHAVSPDEVILFSGGIDSLSGAVGALIGAGRRVALVSHQSSTMVASKQNRLVAELRDRTLPGSIFYMPVTINKGREEAIEFTQRTRSLLFAALGLIVARMFRRNELSFYENGMVSINLPISEHAIGARASRTTHPRVLADCSRLFSLLLDEPFTVHNPFVWKTKSEVVRVLEDFNSTDLIVSTLSCTRVREATKRRQHCGVCSQCVDRRFGVLAAGLGEYEASDAYAVDLFTGAHEPGPALTMIESYVLRAQKLTTMSEQAFVATYGQIFRAIPHLQGSPDENVRKLWELHRRHGQEVVGVIDAEIERKAGLTQMLDLPTTCLLSLIVSPIAKQPDYLDSIEMEPTAVEQAALDQHDYTRQQIQFAIDDAARKVMFKGGLSLGGPVYQLVASLGTDFVADVDAGTFRHEHRFVNARLLAKRFKINEQSLRARVSRARATLEKAFLDTFDRQLDSEDIIQNQVAKGYRLNPYLLLVQPAQLRGESSGMSQQKGRSVTTPRAAH